MAEFVQIFKEVGFPVGVCLWFMLSSDKKMDKMVSLLDKICVKVGVPGVKDE